MIDLEDVKLWISRRRLDIKYWGEMITQVTISSFVNDEGKTEYVQTWEYIRRKDRQHDAKELSGEKNMWLVDRIDRKDYPNWATDAKHLTATGAYNFMMDRSIDKVYKNFKDWEHINIKTVIIVVLVIIGIAYAVFLVS